MKKIGSLIGIVTLILLFSNCDKKESTNPDYDLIIGNWKLIGLVNISDEQKYLNTNLELFQDSTYSNEKETGESIITGTWLLKVSEDYIYLSSGIFDGYPSNYRIMKIDATSLQLEEHYTLDNKDAYLEYHYARN